MQRNQVGHLDLEAFSRWAQENGRTCAHPSTPAVAKRLRDEYKKEEARKHYSQLMFQG